MRHKQAPAEKIMWACLRDRQLNGFKFRRQFPIGRYVADFYCAACRLFVELDGASHFDQEAHDAERTRWLQTQGYRVVRYSNSDVHKYLDAVLNNLLDHCEGHAPAVGDTSGPSPPPSPLSTGERG